MTGTMSDPKASIPAADIVALPDPSFRMKRYLIVAMLVGMGSWFCYDGFYNWPKQLREAEALEKQQLTPSEKPHSQKDIFYNQVLGIALPPLGLLALAYFLYGSRGEYKLSGQTLHIPGHEPIPVEAITLIDKSKWDRKGIARIEYERTSVRPSGAAAGGPASATDLAYEQPAKPCQFRLDNFVYQEEPTRLILKRLEEVLFPEEENTPPRQDA
jgi:hypothetical protein